VVGVRGFEVVTTMQRTHNTFELFLRPVIKRTKRFKFPSFGFSSFFRSSLRLLGARVEVSVDSLKTMRCTPEHLRIPPTSIETKSPRMGSCFEVSSGSIKFATPWQIR